MQCLRTVWDNSGPIGFVCGVVKRSLGRWASAGGVLVVAWVGSGWVVQFPETREVIWLQLAAVRSSWPPNTASAVGGPHNRNRVIHVHSTTKSTTTVAVLLGMILVPKFKLF